MKRVVQILALAALLVLGLAPTAPAGELIFNLDWVVFGRHAPYYVALEKGYYKDAGLDIKIVRGYGSSDAINKITTGQATFAFGDAGSLVIARGKGAQVKLVAMIYGKSPFAIYSLPDTKIAAPKDLEGKTIAAPTFDAPRNMFPVFAKLTGIDAGKVKWLTVDGGQKDPMLFAKKTDAITEFTPQIPILSKRAKEQNVGLNIMKWADYGFALYSNGLMVSDEVIKSKPQMVKGFVQATVKGLQYTFDHPDEAVAMIMKHHPTLDKAVARAELDIVKDLVLTEDAKQHGIGWMNEKTMQTSVDWVAEAFKVEKPPLASLYTNEDLK